MISAKQYWRLLSTYLRPLRTKVFLLAALILAGVGLKVLNPLIIRHFIDTATTGDTLRALTTAGFLFLFVGLVVECFSIAANYLGSDIGYRATDKLRADLMQHTLGLDLNFHHRHPPGEMIERLDGDVATLNNFFSQFALLILGNALLLVGILAMFYREDWRMGSAFTGFSIVSILLYSLLRERSAPHWRAQREARSQLTGFVEERLSGLEDLRSNGAQAEVMRGLSQAAGRDYRRGFAATRVHNTVNFLTLIPNNLAGVLVLGVGAYLYTQDGMTIGTVYLCYHYYTMLLIPLQIIQYEFGSLQRVSGSLQRIDELYHTKTTVTDGHRALAPTGPPQVKFTKVSFRYARGDLVIKNFSLTLEAGHSLGLLGHTGSGKTTLTRLLFRFCDPTAGHITFAGQPLTDLRLDDLRRYIGLITQEVQLVDATLRDNLTFFQRDMADGPIQKAIESLGLSTWFAALPQGLDTPLSAGSLSAGEAQLLALIRVFLKNPGLVVLDEASARLDPFTEGLLETALAHLLTNRTSIIIAHRLRTLQRVDDIAVLERGVLIEHGRRQSLEQDPTSHLAQLLATGSQPL